LERATETVIGLWHFHARIPLWITSRPPAQVNSVIPAVIAGNSVLIKHSDRSPLCSDHFAQTMAEASGRPELVQVSSRLPASGSFDTFFLYSAGTNRHNAGLA
jgi:hypothetical protein